MGSVRGLAMVLGCLLVSGVAHADPPPLKVIRLTPSKPAPSKKSQQIHTLLKRIADDRTDSGSDRRDFESILERGAAAVPALTETLKNEKANFQERWVAARALGRIGGPDALQALRHTLENDRFSMCRLAAITALRNLGDRSVVPSLVQALEDDAVIVRSGAADALSALGSLKVVPALLKALDSKGNFYRGQSLWVRAHIVKTLGDLQSRNAVPTLVTLLDDKDEKVGLEAIRSLEKVTRVRFPSSSENPREYARSVTPQWKRWWEKNKNDFQ